MIDDCLSGVAIRARRCNHTWKAGCLIWVNRVVADWNSMDAGRRWIGPLPKKRDPLLHYRNAGFASGSEAVAM
jgi:hypothetical protein